MDASKGSSPQPPPLPRRAWPRAAALAAALLALACEEAPPSTAVDGADDIGDGGGLKADVSLTICKVDADCAALKKPCRAVACSAEGTCVDVAAADGGTCDDGDPCTSGEACSGGVCVGASACECQTDGDCKAKEDGDRCNGTLFCDTSGALPACKVNPATVVTCDVSGDTACKKSACLRVGRTGAHLKLSITPPRG